MRAHQYNHIPLVPWVITWTAQSDWELTTSLIYTFVNPLSFLGVFFNCEYETIFSIREMGILFRPSAVCHEPNMEDFLGVFKDVDPCSWVELQLRRWSVVVWGYRVSLCSLAQFRSSFRTFVFTVWYFWEIIELLCGGSPKIWRIGGTAFVIFILVVAWDRISTWWAILVLWKVLEFALWLCLKEGGLLVPLDTGLSAWRLRGDLICWWTGFVLCRCGSGLRDGGVTTVAASCRERFYLHNSA